MTGRLIINNDEYVEFDENVTAIDAWYDRHSRSWVIQKLNKDGYQVDDAVYVGDKETKNTIVKELKEQFGL